MNYENNFEHIFRAIVREENEKLYNKLTKSVQANHKPKASEVMNFEGFCKYVGCSRSHAYKLTSKCLVPFSRRNGRLWFSKSDIDHWLMSESTETPAELEENAQQYLKMKKSENK
ncbi:MAG: helix-turn-helix domain-containing protein [Bacteroidota bacterium]|nr:helix-turn-helix domain-containing protein [Bacteroidota bacterium]